jgi:hypothetical protein
MTAPLESDTWPVIDPVTVCPKAAGKTSKVTSKHPKDQRNSIVLMTSSIRRVNHPKGKGTTQAVKVEIYVWS